MKKLLTILSLFACMLVGNTQAQTLLSGVDGFFGNASVFGWACFPDQPDAKVTVYLGLYDGNNWAWSGAQAADKQRNDVGRAGVCGSPTAPIESYYHGFEAPVLPLDQLPRNTSYGVYAWINTSTPPYYQYLNGGGAISTYESGLPTSRTWRTDYEDPNLKQPALISCIWPFHGANQREIPGTPTATNAGWNPPPTDRFLRWTVGGGATPAGTTADGTAAPYGDYVGFDTPNNYCLNFPANTTIPAPWASSNSAAGSPYGALWPTASSGYPSWPTGNYWVIHANNETAYLLNQVKASSGPPSQSEPVTGGLYSVSSSAAGFSLSIDGSSAQHNQKLPFLSIGAQMGRGVGGPLAYVDPSGLETFVEFDITRAAAPQANSAGGYYQGIDVIVEAIFNGAKRQIWIGLGYSQASAHQYWNWNAAQSFFYPGADLNRFYGSEARACPNMPASSEIPELAQFSIGTTKRVSIPIRAIFKCIDDLPWNHDRKWGNSPLAYNLPLMISGVHLGIEMGNLDVGQHAISLTAPQFVRR